MTWQIYKLTQVGKDAPRSVDLSLGNCIKLLPSVDLRNNRVIIIILCPCIECALKYKSKSFGLVVVEGPVPGPVQDR